ncbi:MAG: 30S ribosomal protein S11 [Thermoflexales bacterium]
MEKAGTSHTSRRQTTMRRARKNVAHAVVHIYAPFNNTIITITDTAGNTICWASAGSAGFKGTRKSTPFAARVAAQNAYRMAIENGVQEVDVVVKGPGPGREAAVRALQGTNLRVRSITDATPVPHNGCRPKKRRRI